MARGVYTRSADLESPSLPEVALAIRFLAGGLPAIFLIGAIARLRGFRLDSGPRERGLQAVP